LRRSSVCRHQRIELIDLLIKPLTPASGAYDFNEYGYLVLVEEGDLDGVIDLPEIDCTFEEVFELKNIAKT